jgi:hypothetical protein
MDACSQCPHSNDCQKVGACLDDINVPWIAKDLHPRFMIPAPATTFMNRLRSGESQRRLVDGGTLGVRGAS